VKHRIDAAQAFMVETWGPKSAQPDQEAIDLWNQRLGILVSFAGFLAQREALTDESESGL
jgi:hypothetical protein